MAVADSANEIPVGEVPSMMDVEHKEAADKLSIKSGSVDTAISLLSSSSYSVITLKDSLEEVVLDDRVLSHPETVPVAAAASEEDQQLNCTERQPSNASPTSSARALSTITTQAVGITSFTDDWDTGFVCSKGVAISVDRLERKLTLRNKSKLKITEHIAEVYRYTPSFQYLPAILESCISDDALLSDVSVASGDGYVADGGLTRSESYHSNASSPTASLCNVAECNNQQHLSHDSDEARFSVTSASSCGERVLHLEGESFAVSAGDSRQLSAKSLSDGIDSAVVCTPYSSQTSRDSATTVDNSSYCHSVGVAIDDPAPQLLPSVAAEMRPVTWENVEVGHATEHMIACHESARKDSDDELSIMSDKVEWGIDSDSEITKHSEASVIAAPLIKSGTTFGTTFVRQPFPTVSSIQSLEEQSRELERHWCGERITRRACCACVSCVIMRQSVSTAADVVPTMSVRLCSSVVDVVCLIRRLVDICHTWLQVLCDSAYHHERSCRSGADKCSQKTALMRSTSEVHAACAVGVVRDDVTDSSAHANRQHHHISEGLENMQESLLQRLFDVSDIL